MSLQAIHAYHNAVRKIFQYSGANHEQAIKDEFKKLINVYCETQNLLLVSEISEPIIDSKNNKRIEPDGIVFDWTQSKRGYWESKANVDLEKEITINAGYSLENILFQDNKKAILYRNNERYLSADLKQERELDHLLTEFVHYESKETKEFLSAIEQFKVNLPVLLEKLREMLIEQDQNTTFVKARTQFLHICQNSINPDFTIKDVNEILIQHILTEEIFISVFSNAQFHQENSIAKELYILEKTFFIGKIKRDTLASIQSYYEIIRDKAKKVHHKNRQTFLKAIYENFYKVYNPKAADKQGIVYTPDEIVQFQIESVDTLLQKHFRKTLADEGVKILDPCTGTGTYLCDVIDYLPAHRLEHKYKHDLFANELGLLPYYIASLNIEYTYQQKMGHYEEFEHICWVDTLDNTGFGLKGSSTDLFGFSAENTERIKKQNSETISVIIGNPPYNANQQNENDNNKNREYKEIDRRIKDTYIKYSTAQKTKVYDMYSRFYRWASDRIEQGIIAFITNNSFINSKTFDGFRKCITDEFDFAYIVDLKGDIRGNYGKSLKISNVFGIQTGVALMFLVKVKNDNKKPCKIVYTYLVDEMLKSEKLTWLTNNKLENLNFDLIIPDNKNNWINQTDNDFNTLLPLCSKEVKTGKSQEALFNLFSLGVATNRDEWVYDFNKNYLVEKVILFTEIYNSEIKRWQQSEQKMSVNNFVDRTIKWTEELESHLTKGNTLKFDKKNIVYANYRPFVKRYFYFDGIITHRIYQNDSIFGFESKYKNTLITTMGDSTGKPFFVLAINLLPDLNFVSPASGGTQCLPLYVYDKEGNQHDNITDWALNQFKSHYEVELTKLDIFHYVYAVLHNPDYRKKYELNLKRDFPRIPFYSDFFQWVEYGKQLMELHLYYETVEPYPLEQHDSTTVKIPKAKLKADKVNGTIILDDNTYLSGVPTEAWKYKLGNRSALEWILDQYKEKKPKDPTIAERFYTYRFADYKEQVIDLLRRVCTVSVRTVAIVKEWSILK